MKTSNGQEATPDQVERVKTLLGQQGVPSVVRETIKKMHGSPFDLPDGYIAGWILGVYYGIDVDGRAGS